MSAFAENYKRESPKKSIIHRRQGDKQGGLIKAKNHNLECHEPQNPFQYPLIIRQALAHVWYI